MRGAPTDAARWGLAVACALLAVWMFASAVDQRDARDAANRAASGDAPGAIAAAAKVSRRPARLRAELVRARALAAAGRPAEAIGAFAAAAHLAPNDWALRRDWALAERARGANTDARRQLGRALLLNPRMPVPPELLTGPG